MTFRYLLLLPLLIVLSLFGCTPTPRNMWKCTATDAGQNHWVKYSPTRVEAAVKVGDLCRADNYPSTCIVRCAPPTVRWHCIAIDRKGNTWYWNSRKRQVAIRNARNACLKNTIVGGCRVPMGNCSMT